MTTLDVEIARGETRAVVVLVARDDEGALRDLAGWTVTCEVRTLAGGTGDLVYELEGEISGANVYFAVPATPAAETEPGSYFHTITAVDPDEVETELADGTWTVVDRPWTLAGGKDAATLANGDYGDVEVSASGGTISLKAGVVTDGEVAAANKDGAAGTASMRTLGPGAQQAAAGNHDHAGVYQPVGSYAAASHAHAQSDVTGLDAAVTFTSATPSAPATGKVSIYGRDVGGRQMLAMRGPTDTPVAVQPHTGMVHVSEWLVNGNTSALPTGVGMAAPTSTGTPTTRNVAAGSMFAAARRIGMVSSASAGNSAAFRAGALQFLLGDAAGAGGFTFVCRFGVSDAATVANSRMFVGLQTAITVIGNVEPSSLASIIGVGCDAGETTLSIMHNDGSGTATKVSLGANFPSQTLSTDIYQLELFSAPNSGVVTYRVTRLNTGHTASGTLSSDLPAGTTLLAPQIWRNNGATALAVGIDLFGLYIETDT